MNDKYILNKLNPVCQICIEQCSPQPNIKYIQAHAYFFQSKNKNTNQQVNFQSSGRPQTTKRPEFLSTLLGRCSSAQYVAFLSLIASFYFLVVRRGAAAISPQEGSLSMQRSERLREILITLQNVMPALLLARASPTLQAKASLKDPRLERNPFYVVLERSARATGTTNMLISKPAWCYFSHIQVKNAITRFLNLV